MEAKGFEDVISFMGCNTNQSLTIKSNYLQRILNSFSNNNWVDLERYYFRLLKSFFKNTNLERSSVQKLNQDFEFLIQKLICYLQFVNSTIDKVSRLEMERVNLKEVFRFKPMCDIKYLTFNYTDTLTSKHYADDKDIIHIHGRVSDIERNPIIFGYGDETDPDYQNIEDSGDNVYLQHIKSFAYFKTDNYNKLLSFIDSSPFTVHIVGHSCGLSDRVLLNTIFEHSHCASIEIFYYQQADGIDNFKEITQEISRHFRPQNKGLMRRRILNKNSENIIPQNAPN